MKRDLMDYVPKKLQDYCYDAFRDSDGIWFYFKECDGKIPQFYSTGCPLIHEDTINQCRGAMRDYYITEEG